MWTTPITIAEYLAAPLSNRGLMPPFEPGLYAAALRPWSGEPKRDTGILYVGSTAKGQAELLYRVSLFVLESIGFTGRDLPPPKPPKRKRWEDYYHSGGAKVWRYCADPHFPARKANDPFTQRDPNREVFIAWCPKEPRRCKSHPLLAYPG